MKSAVWMLILSVLLIMSGKNTVSAQSHEIQQLVLNIQKLAQLKEILSQMYKGYEILSTGYNTIKDLSQGNFSLHKVFLDNLLGISPTVRKYKRVVEIITIQKQLLQHSRNLLKNATIQQMFQNKDLDYIKNVYTKLIDRSLDNLQELLMIVTANHLRMSDAERLQAIDRIYEDMVDKLRFSRYFYQKTTLLAVQRQHTSDNYKSLRAYFE